MKFKGTSTNDFVDRYNNLKDPNTNDYYNKTTFVWGSTWRVDYSENKIQQYFFQIYLKSYFLKNSVNRGLKNYA